MGIKILVTGTDTGVGKTYVSCQLIKYLRGQGLKVRVLKAVESGVDTVEQTDAERLYECLGGEQSLESICTYKLNEPLSPHVASKRDGVDISISKIKKEIEQLSAQCDFLIVEGAGGLLVPIKDDYSFADLAKEADLYVLIVAASKLGVINHLLLTAEVAKKRGLKLLPYILNDMYSGFCKEKEEQALAIKLNQEAIELVIDIECLATVKFQQELSFRKDFLKLF